MGLCHRQIGIVLLLVLIGLGLFIKRKGWGPWKDKKASAYTSLLSMCLNDRTQAARLIAAEKKRAPGISDQTACRRAIHRIQRGNQ